LLKSCIKRFTHAKQVFCLFDILEVSIILITILTPSNNAYIKSYCYLMFQVLSLPILNICRNLCRTTIYGHELHRNLSRNLEIRIAISLDGNIFGKKYFAVLFYEWDTFEILNKHKIFFCMVESNEFQLGPRSKTCYKNSLQYEISCLSILISLFFSFVLLVERSLLKKITVSCIQSSR